MQPGWKSIWIAVVLGGSLFAGDLLPLREGNSWTYAEARTGRTFSIQVGSAVTSNDHTYYLLTGYVDQPLLVRLDEQNRLVYLDEASGAETVLTSFVPEDGQWWDAPVRACNQQGQTLDTRGTYKGPMGVVNGVVEVRYRTMTCADAGIESEQYAENIGMLRRVVQSIAGPRQWDLIYAKVGEIVIDVVPHARFSVSVNGQSATIRLQTNSPLPLKLQFATGQEYDLILRAGDGTVVWKWSAGQNFIQSLHELTVDGEWSKTVALPRQPAGTYTLQAWLTTIGDTPQFAATVSLSIDQ
jgi:hypothetical protein